MHGFSTTKMTPEASDPGDFQGRLSGRAASLGNWRALRDKMRTKRVRKGECPSAALARMSWKRWRTHQDSNLRPLPSEGSALSS